MPTIGLAQGVGEGLGDFVDAREGLLVEGDVSGFEIFVELFDGGCPEDDGSDKCFLAAPGQGQLGDGDGEFLGERHEACDGLQAAFVDKAVGHFLLALALALEVLGEAGIVGNLVAVVFTGAYAAAQRGVGQATEGFALAYIGQGILEAAVHDRVIVLDGFIAAVAAGLGDMFGGHRSPGGLIAAANDADFAFINQFREYL